MTARIIPLRRGALPPAPTAVELRALRHEERRLCTELGAARTPVEAAVRRARLDHLRADIRAALGRRVEVA